MANSNFTGDEGNLGANPRSPWIVRRQILVLFLVVACVDVVIFSYYSLETLTGPHIYLPLYLHRTQDLVLIPTYLFLILLASWLARTGWAQRNGIFNFITPTWLWALMAAIICVVGGTYVYHSFPLSMDEYFADFQAEIFAAGSLAASVPAEWIDFSKALQHSSFVRLTDGGAWYSAFGPINSVIRALVGFANAKPLINPVACGASLFVIAALARKIWPQSRSTIVVAVLLLFASAQFLSVGMSSYAHSLHLLFNLLWLLLYLRNDRTGHAIAGMISIAAIGLHQVHYHLFFVLPFICHMVWQRRWSLAGFYCSCWAAAFLVFAGWPRLTAWLESGIELAAFFGVVGDYGNRVASATSGNRYQPQYYLTAGISNIVRLITWQHLALLPLAIIALAGWRRLPTIVKLLALGIAVTLVVRLAVTPNQGHGWGYRYLHNMLGNLALIGAAGWFQLNEESQDKPNRWRAVFLFCTVFTVFIVLPWRFSQVQAFVEPYAKAYRSISARPVDLVIVDTGETLLARDLVRNDPWLRNRPILIDKSQITWSQLAALKNRHKVNVVSSRQLKNFGMISIPEKRKSK